MIRNKLPFEEEIMLLVILALSKNDSGTAFGPPQDVNKQVLQHCKTWKELKENFDVSVTQAKISEEQKEKARRIFPQVVQTAEAKQYICCFIKQENGDLTPTTSNMDSDQLYFAATLAGREKVYAIIRKMTNRVMLIIVGIFLSVALLFFALK